MLHRSKVFSLTIVFSVHLLGLFYLTNCVHSFFRYEGPEDRYWCFDCLCGLEKQPVLNDEYCCISNSTGCQTFNSREYGRKQWCPNARVQSQLTESCYGNCYDQTVNKFSSFSFVIFEVCEFSKVITTIFP